MTDERIDDIAVFFQENDQAVGAWLRNDEYTKPEYEVDPSKLPSWFDNAVFGEQPIDESNKAEGAYFVVNLRKLLDPGTSIQGTSGNEKMLRNVEKSKPSSGALLIIPWNKEHVAKAYLVPQTTYTDPAKCQRLGGAGDADMKFMALAEGVILANIPKADLAGMTCYILNLCGLRSQALKPDSNKSNQ